jgi:hypothetical protein
MKSWSTSTVVLAVVCALQAGILLGRDGIASTAIAQEPAAPRFALECRSFAVDPAKDPLVQTSDKTTEIGKWVSDREAEGWTLYSLDFEIGQKPTGYPQGWLQVCTAPGAPA